MYIFFIAGIFSGLTYALTQLLIPYYHPHHELLQNKNKHKYIFVLFVTYLPVLLILHDENLNYYTLSIYFLLIIIVMTAALLDSQYMVIPDRLLIVFLPSIFILQLLNNQIIEGFLGGLFAFTLLLLIAIISQGGIGGGDIKLFTIIGLSTSFTFVYQLLLFSSLMAFIIGLFSRITGRRKKHEMVPFGPTIAVVTILLICYDTSVQEGIV